MINPIRIPLLQSNGEPVPRGPLFRVIESSVGASCRDVVMEEQQVPNNEWTDVMYKQHVIAVNIGRAMNCEFKKGGSFQKLLKPTGAISFFPSRQPFSVRMMQSPRKWDRVSLAYCMNVNAHRILGEVSY